MDSSGNRINREIFTIGHSNHSRESFIALLKQHHIELIIDVRARPASRFARWANKKVFSASLPDDGLDYVYLGNLVGGFPRSELPDRPPTCSDFDEKQGSPEFREGIKKIEKLACARRAALMCAEEDPGRCHRSLLIAPALVERGWKVMHIRRDGGLDEGSGKAGGLPLFD